MLLRAYKFGYLLIWAFCLFEHVSLFQIGLPIETNKITNYRQSVVKTMVIFWLHA